MSDRNPGDDLGLTGQNSNDARATDGAQNSPRTDRERMKDENENEMGCRSVQRGARPRGVRAGPRHAETPKAASDRMK